MDSALHFYERAQDYLSLARVYCYMGNIQKVTNVAWYQDKLVFPIIDLNYFLYSFMYILSIIEYNMYVWVKLEN